MRTGHGLEFREPSPTARRANAKAPVARVRYSGTKTTSPIATSSTCCHCSPAVAFRDQMERKTGGARLRFAPDGRAANASRWTAAGRSTDAGA
jgi:hypothetical protein